MENEARSVVSICRDQNVVFHVNCLVFRGDVSEPRHAESPAALLHLFDFNLIHFFLYHWMENYSPSRYGFHWTTCLFLVS